MSNASDCVTADHPGYVPSLGPVASKRLRSDVFGHLVEVGERLDDGSFALTSCEYDGAGNLARAVNPDGIDTVLEHDWAGRRVAITRGQRTFRYEYDANGNTRAEISPLPPGASEYDYRTQLAYDELDRVTSRLPAPRRRSLAEQEELGIGLIVYEYDDGVNGLGRLTGVTIGNVGTIAYDHDARGNVTGETRSFNLGDLGANISDSRTVHYQYNALGQEVESRYQNAGSPDTRIYTEYDRRGLPERALWQGSYTVELGSIKRNVAGRPVRLHTGPVGGRYTGERRWDYDDLGRVLGDRFSSPKGGELFRHDYSYGGDEVMALHMDVKGRERNMVFDYDSRHQIVAASDNVGYDAAFAYTAAGRVASAFVDAQPAFFAPRRDVIYSYDDIEPEAVAELTNADSGDRYASYAYDRAGNLISRKPGNGQSSIGHYFDYDGDDQQRRVVATAGSSELYIYDHSGNRMIALTRAPGGATVKARQWFGGSEIWYGASGNVTKTWVHVGLGTPLARIENGRRLEYNFHSMLGHMVLATDVGGGLKAGYNYGPFGEVLDRLGDADNHLRRFNGKEFDVASGLSYYGARYYDLESMSWTQADPLYRFVPDLAFDEPRKMNLYVFTLNNPVQFVDPDGRDALGWCSDLVFEHTIIGEVYRTFYDEGPRQGTAMVAMMVAGRGRGGKGRGGRGSGGKGRWSSNPRSGGKMTGGTWHKIVRNLHKKAVDLKTKLVAGGGGKTGRKVSKDAIANGKRRVAEARAKRDALRAKPDKTRGDKAELKKAEKALNKATDQLRASENHAQSGQGYKQ